MKWPRGFPFVPGRTSGCWRWVAGTLGSSEGTEAGKGHPLEAAGGRGVRVRGEPRVRREAAAGGRTALARAEIDKGVGAATAWRSPAPLEGVVRGRGLCRARPQVGGSWWPGLLQCARHRGTTTRAGGSLGEGHGAPGGVPRVFAPRRCAAATWAHAPGL